MLMLLKKYWLETGLSVALTLSLLALSFQGRAYDAAKANLRAEKTMTATLSAQLAQQNAAVDSLVVQRKEDREAYLAGIRAANGRAIKLEVDAERILALPTPDDQCAATEAMLRKELTK